MEKKILKKKVNQHGAKKKKKKNGYTCIEMIQNIPKHFVLHRLWRWRIETKKAHLDVVNHQERKQQKPPPVCEKNSLLNGPKCCFTSWRDDSSNLPTSLQKKILALSLFRIYPHDPHASKSLSFPTLAWNDFPLCHQPCCKKDNRNKGRDPKKHPKADNYTVIIRCILEENYQEENQKKNQQLTDERHLEFLSFGRDGIASIDVPLTGHFLWWISGHNKTTGCCSPAKLKPALKQIALCGNSLFSLSTNFNYLFSL